MAELQIKAKAKYKSICPHFVAPDVVASAEYYRDVLGFKILSYFLDPLVFAVVARDDVVIHFGKSDNRALPSPNVTRRSIGIDLGERSRCLVRGTAGARRENYCASHHARI